jgi:hypothetical protein
MKRIRPWVRSVLREIKCRLRSPRALTAPCDDPSVALASLIRSEATIAWCPVEWCVMFNGLSLASHGYHPFAAASAELLARPAQRYPGSRLEHYYAAWQPADALEALIGAPNAPVSLRRYPRYLMPEPWTDVSLDDRLAFVEQTMRWESVGIGEELLGPEDGHGLQGPVTRRKGEVEFRRLRRPLRSIARKGFDRRYGDLAAQLLRRGPELRCRIIHGHHRAGILAALGREKIVLRLTQLVDIKRIDEWPQVRNGTWSAAQAEEYFNHHFDFDSGAWARDRGLP